MKSWISCAIVIEILMYIQTYIDIIITSTAVSSGIRLIIHRIIIQLTRRITMLIPTASISFWHYV